MRWCTGIAWWVLNMGWVPGRAWVGRAGQPTSVSGGCCGSTCPAAACWRSQPPPLAPREAAVARALGAQPDCVFRDASLRDNLRLHVKHINGGPHPACIIPRPQKGHL